MGLTAFNRMRREQEKKKRASKVSESDLQKVRDLCADLEVQPHLVAEAIQALKAGTLKMDKVLADLEKAKIDAEFEKSTRDPKDNLDPSSSEDLPPVGSSEENPPKATDESSPEEVGQAEMPQDLADEALSPDPVALPELGEEMDAAANKKSGSSKKRKNS